MCNRYGVYNTYKRIYCGYYGVAALKYADNVRGMHSHHNEMAR